MSSKSKQKPKSKVTQPEAAPTETPRGPKENTKAAISLCHDLIFTAGYPYERADQVKAALGFLESLFKQVDAESTPAASTPAVVAEVVSE